MYIHYLLLARKGRRGAFFYGPVYVSVFLTIYPSVSDFLLLVMLIQGKSRHIFTLISVYSTQNVKCYSIFCFVSIIIICCKRLKISIK